jgi:hypothetical protein
MSAIDSLLPDSGKIAIDKPHPYQQLVSDQLLLGRTAHLRGHVSKEWKQAFVEARGPTTNPNIEQVASVWMGLQQGGVDRQKFRCARSHYHIFNQSRFTEPAKRSNVMVCKIRV